MHSCTTHIHTHMHARLFNSFAAWGHDWLDSHLLCLSPHCGMPQESTLKDPIDKMKSAQPLYTGVQQFVKVQLFLQNKKAWTIAFPLLPHPGAEWFTSLGEELALLQTLATLSFSANKREN